MNKWIILVAGPVVFGACSIKRQTESQRRVSTELATVETRSGIRRDSLVVHLERAVRIDRSWTATLPYSGAVYRYDERVYIDENAAVGASSMTDSSITAQKQERTDRNEHRSEKAQSKARGVGWWWVIAFGFLVLWAVRQFRVWPFK